jgi:23S rRNA-/tRNA-specific pseudouridylate synthase
VLVNGRVVRLSSWTVEADDIVTVHGPLLSAVPHDGPVVFEPAWLLADDGDIIAVDKPAGLRPEAVRLDDDRPNLLGLARASDEMRDGERLVLAHRLDRDTSGVMLLTRPGPIRAELDRAFKAHAVRKEYLARVDSLGTLAVGEIGIIDSRIGPDPSHRARMAVVERGGDRARTRYQVIGDLFVRLWPETGRTHQLRVQLASLGAPIAGDRLYGPDSPSASRLMLHACRVTLPDGRSYSAPLPPDFGP